MAAATSSKAQHHLVVVITIHRAQNRRMSINSLLILRIQIVPFAVFSRIATWFSCTLTLCSLTHSVVKLRFLFRVSAPVNLSRLTPEGRPFFLLLHLVDR